METTKNQSLMPEIRRPNLTLLALQLEELRLFIDQQTLSNEVRDSLQAHMGKISASLDTRNLVDEVQKGDECDPVLTRREREIMGWIARGKSNWTIAEILGISRHTVDTHVRRAFQKLDANDRTTAAIRAMRLGALELAA